MANKETNIQKQQMLELSRAGSMVFRNETFGAWAGRVIHNDGDMVTIKSARFIKGGLCNGSSDIIGVTPVTITADMVGKQIGVFTAVESKTAKGKEAEDQKTFRSNVERVGGFSIVARSARDAVKLIAEKIKQLSE